MESDDKMLREFAHITSRVNLCLIEGDGGGKREQFQLVLLALDLWLKGKLGHVVSSDGGQSEDPLLQAPRDMLLSLLKAAPKAGRSLSFQDWAKVLPMKGCYVHIASRILAALAGNPGFPSLRVLVGKRRNEVSDCKHLGKKSLMALETALGKYGLSFGMNLADLDKRLEKVAVDMF